MHSRTYIYKLYCNNEYLYLNVLIYQLSYNVCTFYCITLIYNYFENKCTYFFHDCLFLKLMFITCSKNS